MHFIIDLNTESSGLKTSDSKKSEDNIQLFTCKHLLLFKRFFYYK